MVCVQATSRTLRVSRSIQPRRDGNRNQSKRRNGKTDEAGHANAMRNGRTHPVVDQQVAAAVAKGQGRGIRIATPGKNQDAVEDDVPHHKGQDEPERGRKFCRMSKLANRALSVQPR